MTSYIRTAHLIIFGLVLLFNSSVAKAEMPTAPFQTDEYTRLLLHFDNEPVKDESGMNVTIEKCEGGIIPGGKFDKALDFSTANHALVVPASVFVAGQGTFEVWIKPRKYAPNSTTIFENNRLSEYGAFFTFAPSGVLLYYYPEGKDDMVSFVGVDMDDVVSLENWHHVALCWDKNSSKIFIDGICKAEGGPLEMNNAGKLIVGNLTADGNDLYYFNGLIDELRISSVVRYKK